MGNPAANTPRKQAIAFIAAYDLPGAGDYEQHVVRLARTWLSIQRSKQSVQGIVDRIMHELHTPVPDHYGCAWDDLRKQFTAWAVKEEWADPPAG